MGNYGGGEAFEACFRSKCQVSKLISKASLTYFMQYFASILVYTGAVAGIQRKKSNHQDLTMYLINDCSSLWIMRVSLWSTNCVVTCAECTLAPPPHTQKGGHRVACASAETVQCLRSQNS